MKILFAITNLYKETGGSYKAFIETARAVHNKNVDIKIIYLKDDVIKNNISIPEIYKGVDIIHFFGGWDYFSIKLILYAFYRKIKVIISPMGLYEPWSLQQKAIKKKIAWHLYQKYILKKSDLIICSSYSEKRNIYKLIKKNNIVTLPHGIDKNLINHKKNFFEAKKKRALFFSRIHKKKGLIELTTIWCKINPKNWELIIVGPEEDDTKKNVLKIVRYNHNSSIKFLKPIFDINEKNKLFLSSDLFLLPSYSENFSYSIIEALQLKLPVLTSAFTPWQTIKQYNAGWVVDNLHESLEKNLRNIFKLKKKDFEEKSKNCSQLLKRYYWDNLIDQYLRKYKNIYNESSTSNF
jgi:glycosyltransferase involved in cell wall biosynthesis